MKWLCNTVELIDKRVSSVLVTGLIQRPLATESNIGLKSDPVTTLLYRSLAGRTMKNWSGSPTTSTGP